MSNAVIYDKLKFLKLSHFAKSLEANFQTYKNQDYDFYEILNLLLDVEINQRHNNRIQNLLKSAKLRYSDARLEEIDYSASRQLKRSDISHLFDCEWINNKQCLIITGMTGTGKTWMGCAFANHACRLEIKTIYVSASQLYEELHMSILDGSIAKVKQKYMKPNLLVIDDFGLGGIDSSLCPALLDIIDKQSTVGGLLITSQFPTEKWHGFFEDATIADAILDRIVHRSHLIELKGESLRKNRTAKK